MTTDQAKTFIAKYPNAVSFVRPSHLEDLSPLYEVHIEAVEVRKDEFHLLTGGVFYPRKETTDRFGNAAGISFASVNITTRKEDGVYVGRAIPQELGPDGKMIQWAPAEYEFDPTIRADEDILRAQRKDASKYKNETDRKLVLLGYKKVGRRRADTGARAAAIISAIGMPTGFKGLFGPNDAPDATRVFLFSRVIVNSKNEMVLNRALDSMFQSAGSLYGPQVVAQITGDVEMATATMERPTERDVTPDAADDYDDFPDDDSGPIVGESKKVAWTAIQEFDEAFALPAKAQARVNGYRADLAGADEDDMKKFLAWLQDWAKRNREAQR